MKKLILSVAAIAGMAVAGRAQQVVFHDSNDASPVSYDTEINGVPNYAPQTIQDLNAELLVGTTAGSVTTDVVTLLLSQTTETSTTALGSVQPAAGDIVALGGIISDQTENGYYVPAGTDYYEILLWSGNQTSYYAAAADGADLGSSGVLQFDADNSPGPDFPPAEEDIASPIYMYNDVIPESSTLTMAGVGIASMLIFRFRRKS